MSAHPHKEDAGRTVRVYVEDRGQDVLWLDIAGDTVTGSNLQAWFWVGKKVTPKKWRKGSRIVFREKRESWPLKYPVTRVAVSP